MAPHIIIAPSERRIQAIPSENYVFSVPLSFLASSHQPQLQKWDK